MDRKIILIVLGVIILSLFGFYYIQTFAIGISVPKVGNYGNKITLDYRDVDISSSIVLGAETRINEAEILLVQAKEKDLSEYDFLHKQFLENMIDLVEKRLDTSKDNLDKAKDFLENENYQKAGEYAAVSSNGVAILPRHLNNILEGREKEDWNRVTAEENNNLEDGGYPDYYVPPETNYPNITEEEVPIR